MIARVRGLLSNRLPAISVAMVAVIITSVFVARFFLAGDDVSVPDLPSVSQVASPTPDAPTITPTNTPIPSTTVTALFQPGASGILTSSDGVVSIAVESGAVDASLNLSYVPLKAIDLPSLPQGFAASSVAFNLVPSLAAFDIELVDFHFNKPIEIAIQLSGSVLEIADSRPDLITVQHYKDRAGWTELPTRLDLSLDTIFTEVPSLSIFAVLVKDPEAADEEPALQVPTATVSPSPTPTPTPVVAVTPPKTSTPTPTPTPTPTDVPNAPTATPESTTETEAEDTPSPPPVETRRPNVGDIRAPSLREPRDGSDITDKTPTFQWRPVDGVDVEYELQISLRNDFTPLLFSQTTSLTTLTLPRRLRLDRERHKWRVRAISSGVEGPFSAASIFTVVARGGGGGSNAPSDTPTDTPSPTPAPPVPDAPDLISPADDAAVDDGQVTFEWSEVSGTDEATYALEVSPIGGPPVIAVTTTDISFTIDETETLVPGIYEWRVQAIGGVDNIGPFSVSRTLTVTPAGIPVLLSPPDGGLTNVIPTFNWAFVADGQSFQIQVSSDGAFSPPLVVEETVEGTFFTLPSEVFLAPDVYFWRVRVVDVSEVVGQFSVVRSFSLVEPQELSIAIDSPLSLDFFSDAEIEVTGAICIPARPRRQVRTTRL